MHLYILLFNQSTPYSEGKEKKTQTKRCRRGITFAPLRVLHDSCVTQPLISPPPPFPTSIEAAASRVDGNRASSASTATAHGLRRRRPPTTNDRDLLRPRDPAAAAVALPPPPLAGLLARRRGGRPREDGVAILLPLGSLAAGQPPYALPSLSPSLDLCPASPSPALRSSFRAERIGSDWA